MQHPPLICGHCGTLFEQSIVVDQGRGAVTICRGCSKGVVLDGPLFATAASMLDLRIKPKLDAIRTVLVREGMIEPPRIVGVVP